METALQLSVGVVLYRTPPEDLERCLRAFELAARRLPAVRIELVLRDQSPAPELREAVKESPTVRYLHAGENRGFGAGQNALAQEAFSQGAAAHLCLNPDAALHPDALANLWRAFTRQPGVGLLEALQFPDEHAKPYDRDTFDTPWCSGCCLLIPRATFERTRGFDERFFMYGEDVDLSWRVRAAGLACRVVPDALAFHHVGDRAPEVARHAMLLRASALLGAKYGDRAYVDFCLDDLRTLHQEAPRLPVFDAPTPEQRAVADFSHRFAFAETRW